MVTGGERLGFRVHQVRFLAHWGAPRFHWDVFWGCYSVNRKNHGTMKPLQVLGVIYRVPVVLWGRIIVYKSVSKTHRGCFRCHLQQKNQFNRLQEFFKPLQVFKELFKGFRMWWTLHGSFSDALQFCKRVSDIIYIRSAYSDSSGVEEVVTRLQESLTRCQPAQRTTICSGSRSFSGFQLLFSTFQLKFRASGVMKNDKEIH